MGTLRYIPCLVVRLSLPIGQMEGWNGTILTPQKEHSYTLFRFECRLCGRPNEYRHEHRDTVEPHVLFTGCAHCGTRNRLHGVPGIRVLQPSAGVNNLVLCWEPSGEDLPIGAVVCEQCGKAMSIMRMKPAWVEKTGGEFVRHKAMYELLCPDGHELRREAPVAEAASPPIGDPGWTGSL